MFSSVSRSKIFSRDSEFGRDEFNLTAIKFVLREVMSFRVKFRV